MANKIKFDDPDIETKELFNEFSENLKKIDMREHCYYRSCKGFVTHIVVSNGFYRKYCLKHSDWKPSLFYVHKPKEVVESKRPSTTIKPVAQQKTISQRESELIITDETKWPKASLLLKIFPGTITYKAAPQ